MSDTTADAIVIWQAAFAKFDAARTEWLMYQRETYDPARAAATGDRLPSGLSQRCDDLCNAYTDAGFALLMVPAPNIGALSVKLHWLFDDVQPGEYSDGYRAENVFAVLADARALAGAAA